MLSLCVHSFSKEHSVLRPGGERRARENPNTHTLLPTCQALTAVCVERAPQTCNFVRFPLTASNLRMHIYTAHARTHVSLWWTMGRPGAKPASEATKKKNRDRGRARARANPEANRKLAKEWRLANTDRKKKTDAANYKKNRVKRLEQMREYSTKNRKVLGKKAVAREKERLKTDAVFAITKRMRARLGAFTRLHNVTKSGHTFTLIGLTPTELSAHLTRQLRPGELLIKHATDHIFPLAKYAIAEAKQQARAMHHSNLQPLTRNENKEKSDRLPTKAMAAKVERWAWPDGVTEDMLPDIYPGWSTALRM